MPNNDLRIQVDGLKELRKSLKKLSEEGNYAKDLRTASKEAADDVAAEARTRAPIKSGKLAASIRGLAQQTGAQVAGGSARVPYFGFIDYGGTIRFKKRKGEIRRPYVKAGRIVYPALNAKRQQVMEQYVRSVRRIINESGLDTDS